MTVTKGDILLSAAMHVATRIIDELEYNTDMWGESDLEYLYDRIVNGLVLGGAHELPVLLLLCSDYMRRELQQELDNNILPEVI